MLIMYIKKNYYSWFSDYCLQLYCYIHNVLVDVSSALLQVFLVCLPNTTKETQFSCIYVLSEFLRRSLMIFIIQGFPAIVFIHIYIYIYMLDSQRFGRCVLRPSSGVSCRTREPTRNFEPHLLFNLRRSLALIPFTITLNNKNNQVSSQKFRQRIKKKRSDALTFLRGFKLGQNFAS